MSEPIYRELTEKMIELMMDHVFEGYADRDAMPLDTLYIRLGESFQGLATAHGNMLARLIAKDEDIEDLKEVAEIIQNVLLDYVKSTTEITVNVLKEHYIGDEK